MFDISRADGPPVAGIPVDDDCFDPAWLDEAAWLNDASGRPETDQPPVCSPSGWLTLELDQGCADPAALSDSELIDAVIGFDRVASWALARQAVLLAEFARRRPEDHPLTINSDTPSRCSEFAPSRDVRCRFPTCGQPAATADLDHTIPYPDGATSEDNLHASCRHHPPPF